MNSFINSPNFKRMLEELIPIYRMMLFAGGTDPVLAPTISFDATGHITLKKHGYDLDIANLKRYYSAANWSEAEPYLNAFGEDLFREKADQVKQIISLDYIADHLIELENNKGWAADFYITYDTVSLCKTPEEQSCLRQALTSGEIFTDGQLVWSFDK